MKKTNKAKRELNKAVEEAKNKVASYKTIDLQNQASKQASEEERAEQSRARASEQDQSKDNIALVKTCQSVGVVNKFLLAIQNQLIKKVEYTESEKTKIDNYLVKLRNYNLKLKEYEQASESERAEKQLKKPIKPSINNDLYIKYCKGYNKLIIDTKAINKDLKKDLKNKLDNFINQIEQATKGEQASEQDIFKIKFDKEQSIALWSLSMSILAIESNKPIDYKLFKKSLLSCYNVTMKSERAAKND